MLSKPTMVVWHPRSFPPCWNLFLQPSCDVNNFLSPLIPDTKFQCGKVNICTSYFAKCLSNQHFHDIQLTALPNKMRLTKCLKARTPATENVHVLLPLYVSSNNDVWTRDTSLSWAICPKSATKKDVCRKPQLPGMKLLPEAFIDELFCHVHVAGDGDCSQIVNILMLIVLISALSEMQHVIHKMIKMAQFLDFDLQFLCQTLVSTRNACR